jgi:2-iminoacetate synthase
MSFYRLLKQYSDTAIHRAMASFTQQDVDRAWAADHCGTSDFLALLSPAAQSCLEEMADLAHHLTLRHFGKTLQLYTPLYLSDYCENHCTYCSFSVQNPAPRKKLSLDEVDKEGAAIAATGVKHILLLTGESRRQSPVAYIGDCVAVLKKYFHSIAIEIYPLTKQEYATLIEQGVDGLTLYQETYDESIYQTIHPAGPKRNYLFRLDAPERAAAVRMRQINIGALLGLADWRKEIFALGLHARYLMDRYPDAEIGVSLPRLQPFRGFFQAKGRVSDHHLVQALLSLRLFLPRLGISISTRETASLRDHLIPLGVTRLSAGSVTSVGGRDAKNADAALPQFEIADHRGVEEIMSMMRCKGYDPVLSDWVPYDA